MAHQTYRVDAVTSAGIEMVFGVLVDAPGWVDWAPGVGVASYEVEGEPRPHGVGAVRSLGARIGPRSREEVVEFDAPRFYAYEIRSAPIPARGYRAEVRLAPTASGGTAIDWTGRFDSRVPGVAWFLRRTVAGFARGLVVESERRASAR
jgi:hypothetical protein